MTHFDRLVQLSISKILNCGTSKLDNGSLLYKNLLILLFLKNLAKYRYGNKKDDSMEHILQSEGPRENRGCTEAPVRKESGSRKRKLSSDAAECEAVEDDRIKERKTAISRKGVEIRFA
uniref:Uncharacterized protein n=1 Tax=Romanomermis culicivorax TaxID=13658 RepID=A0A915KY47_ROMCU